jgi:hypothetical protein
MSNNAQLKPLKWIPGSEVGFSVERRLDGGMNFVFTDVEPETLETWRKFALDHLFESDRLTRNRYDLRKIEHISQEAVELAVEANSDPSSRNIRLAVVVSNDKMREGIQSIADLTPATGAELRIFTDINEAEDWLNRPINLLV